MKIMIIILLLVTIAIILGILYLNAYNDLSIIKTKLDKSSEIIKQKINDKFSLMKKLSAIISKEIKKKDYLKDFNNLNIDNYELQDFDIELNKNLLTMINLKDDYKNLNTKEYKEILKDINKIDEELIANEKYFNKQNNYLIKKLTGYKKIVALLMHLKVENLYEIKKPIDE